MNVKPLRDILGRPRPTPGPFHPGPPYPYPTTPVPWVAGWHGRWRWNQWTGTWEWIAHYPYRNYPYTVW